MNFNSQVKLILESLDLNDMEHSEIERFNNVFWEIYTYTERNLPIDLKFWERVLPKNFMTELKDVHKMLRYFKYCQDNAQKMESYASEKYKSDCDIAVKVTRAYIAARTGKYPDKLLGVSDI